MGSEKQSGGSDDQSKQPGGSGNFANDRERASEAGKKGGQQSQGGSGQANQSGSGRSQQGAVQTDDEDSKESGKESGGSQNQR
jgi:general stress protein YciG